MKRERKKMRMSFYNYSLPGWYFVTICSKDRECCFGSVDSDAVQLSKIGTVVQEYWLKIPQHNDKVILDEIVIMPNHIHGIIVIKSEDISEVDIPSYSNIETNSVGLNDKAWISYWKQSKNNLSTVVGGFKSSTSKYIHESVDESFGWQKSYYDRIIRNETELENIRSYIIANPDKWAEDIEFNLNRDKAKRDKFYQKIFN